VLTGVFAENSVATMAGGDPIKGGWLDGNVSFNYIKAQIYFKVDKFSKKFKQIGYQLLSAVVAAVWSFVLTFIILQLIGFIPFVRVRLDEKEEEM
jgi:Amt family ammonium transporter